MHSSAERDEPTDRERLDGRIAFVTAAFLAAYGFVALLDRIGAPEAFVSVVAPCFTIAALALLGFLLHSMRVSLYYTAGRAAPAAYAGFANAGIVLAIALPFATQFGGGSWFAGVAGGLFLGLAGIAFFLGPLVRKTGVFSFSSLLSARFPGLAPRLCIVATAGASSVFVALAGQQAAVDALVALTGGGRSLAAFAVAVAVLLIAGPGGLLGVVWSASAAAGVALVGFGWSVAMLTLNGDLPGGADGRGWSDAAAAMQSFGALAAPSGAVVQLGVAAAVALGVATLAPALAPYIATHDARDARRAGYAAFGWTLALALLVATLVAAAALAMSRGVVGAAPDRLPDAVYAASGRGDLAICGGLTGSAGQARAACIARGYAPGAPLHAKDIRVAPEYLLSGLPELMDFGAAASGLVASAIIALALALAASGLQACATALGHETLYRMRGETDLTSRRLAVTRFALVGVTAVGATSSALGLFDARLLTALAVGLSAASIAPVAGLAFWPRAGEREATIASIAGLGGMLAGMAIGAKLDAESVALASLAGAVLGFSAGALSALSAARKPAAAEAFLARLLRGDGQISRPDKGA